MRKLYFTLCAEGPTDAMLVSVVRWVLRQHLGDTVAINSIPSRRTAGPLADQISRVVHSSGFCDLLVVHRDAEKRTRASQAVDIDVAIAEVRSRAVVTPSHIRLIPVRESEAWLLFDESAIRRAAGRLAGKVLLGLPRKDHDRVSDPKKLLNDAMDTASELTGRRLDKFRRDRRPEWVADFITDFSPLRRLQAFREFEAEVAAFAADWLATAADTDDE